MSDLLSAPPYAPREQAQFFEEMSALTAHHLKGCALYARIWSDWDPTQANSVADLPYLHVGLFKHLLFKTEGEGLKHQRTLHSSSTSGQNPSQITLDERSSALQSQSSLAILQDAVGPTQRPLLVLDSVRSLRSRGSLSARVAAAMSLRPLASELHFLLKDPMDPASVKWQVVEELCANHDAFLVYGFTWILWQAWGGATIPDSVRQALANKTIHFVHSGGWKKLLAQRVSHAQFEEGLLAALSKDSRVVDFYGLVEQVGVIYPLCEEGHRHVPRWADVLVRDPFTLQPLTEAVGQLQLMNILAWGAPYHNVLTEDLGRLVPGECPCGRKGPRFELIGRIPKAEVRGCANV